MPKSLFLLLLFFLPLAHGAVEIWSATVMHTVTIVIVALWILYMVRKNHLSFYRTPLDLPLLFLLLITVISISFSVYPYASRIQTYKIINYFLIFSFLINTIRDKGELISLVRTIVVFGGLYAISALVLVEGKLLGFKIFSSARNFITLTFVSHNNFAGFLNIILWLCLGLALSHTGIKRALVICIGICIAVAILLSLSRGGTIGFAGGLLFLVMIMAIFRSRRKILLSLLVFPAIVILTITLLGALDPILERMSTLQSPTITGESRLRVWSDTLNIIKDNTWIGTGIGTFKYIYPRYQTESFVFSYNHSHNSYLELTSETGVIGILSLVSIIAVLFIGGVKRLAAQHDKQLQAVGIGSLAGCFAILLHEVTDFNFYIPSNAFLFTVCAAISFTSARIGSDKPFSLIHIHLTDRRKKLFYSVIFLLSTLSLAGVLSPFAGNIYHKEAKKQEMLKNYESAYRALKNAIFLDIGNAEHMSSMGDLMAKNAATINNPAEKEKFYSASVTYYDNAIDASPVRGYYYTKKAFSLMRLDKLKGAEEALKKAVSLSPMDASNYLNLGTFYLEQGEQNKAYQEYKKALLLDEDHLIMLLDAIWEVSPHYESLSQAVPETADLRQSFANYLFKKGLRNAGGKELSFAASLQPAEEELDASLSQKLGRKYLTRNDIRAAKMFEKSGMLDKAISIYNQLIIKNRGKQKSSVYFQQLFNDESDDKLLYIELASLYNKAGRYNEAVNILQKGLDKWPDNKDMKSMIAENYKGQGQFDKAIPIYRQLINEGFTKQAWIYLTLGVLQIKTGQFQEGINTLQEGLKQWPDDKNLQVALMEYMAENYKGQEQFDKAIPIYRKLINEGFIKQAWIYLTLGVLQIKTGQFQEGINTLQEGLKQWPDDKNLQVALMEYMAENYNRKGHH